MVRSGMVFLREVAWPVVVAWGRLMLAAHLVGVAMLLPFGAREAVSAIALLTPAILLLTPLAALHRAAWRKRPPFIGWGYFGVASYGPLLLVVLGMMGLADSGDVWPFAVLYEAAMLAVSTAYIGLLWVGDLLLGGPEPPRRWARRAVAVACLLLAALWTPFVLRADRQDACVDSGGRYLADGRCER